MTTKLELERSVNELMAANKSLNREVAGLERDKDGQRNNLCKMGKELLNVQAQNEDLTNANGALENNVKASKNAINSLNAEVELLQSDNVKFKAMLQMLIGGKYLKKVDVETAADFLRFIDWY